MLEQSTLSETTAPCHVQIVIVTGYSGAGKSTVLRALEDNGFLCIDNLPLPLLQSFFHWVLTEKTNNQRVALGLDIRTGASSQLLEQELKTLGNWKKYVTILFVSSSPTVLLKRFQETRRKHPLAHRQHLNDAIEQEKQLMQPYIELADHILDTDQLTIHQLRSIIKKSFAHAYEQKILVSLISFGFKYGIPPESNFIFDVSMLPNPFFIDGLKECSGKDQAVVDYLFCHTTVVHYWQKFIDFFVQAIENSYKEGRFLVTVAVGCTGGRHRSVAFVERIAQQHLEHAQFLVKHRDIDNEVV